MEQKVEYFEKLKPKKMIIHKGDLPADVDVKNGKINFPEKVVIKPFHKQRLELNLKLQTDCAIFVYLDEETTLKTPIMMLSRVLEKNSQIDSVVLLNTSDKDYLIDENFYIKFKLINEVILDD